MKKHLLTLLLLIAVSTLSISSIAAEMDLGSIKSILSTGQKSEAYFSLKVSNLENSGVVSTDDSLVLNLSIEPNLGDISKLADVYIAVRQNNKWWMLNDKGEFEPWNVSIKKLKPFRKDVYLKSLQDVEVTRGSFIEKGESRLFFAYSTKDTNYLVATPKSFKIDVKEGSELNESADSFFNIFQKEIFSLNVNQAEIITEIPNSDVWTQGSLSKITDINTDGYQDLILVDKNTYEVYILINDGNNSFIEQTITGEVMPSCSEPTYAIEDFNNDGTKDAIIYCKGTRPPDMDFVAEKPIYILNIDDENYEFNDSLYSAYIDVEIDPENFSLGNLQQDQKVAAKTIQAADIDNDGDIDLWVESKGGENVATHTVENVSGEFFKIQTYEKRMDWRIYAGGDGVCSRHYGADFLNIDGDNFPDLVIGQLRDFDNGCQETSGSQSFLNDGKGNFIHIGMLPYPDYSNGYSAVLTTESGDLNKDGFEDLVLLHTRLGNGNNGPKYTSFYIQALLNNGDNTFLDVSKSYFPNFDIYSSENNNGYPQKLELIDFDNDGDLDISLHWYTEITKEHPILFLQHNNLFWPVDFDSITDADPYYGSAMKPIKNNLSNKYDFLYIKADSGNSSIRYISSEIINNFE
jgi:hypothetical protein